MANSREWGEAREKAPFLCSDKGKRCDGKQALIASLRTRNMDSSGLGLVMGSLAENVKGGWESLEVSLIVWKRYSFWTTTLRTPQHNHWAR